MTAIHHSARWASLSALLVSMACTPAEDDDGGAAGAAGSQSAGGTGGSGGGSGSGSGSGSGWTGGTSGSGGSPGVGGSAGESGAAGATGGEGGSAAESGAAGEGGSGASGGSGGSGDAGSGGEAGTDGSGGGDAGSGGSGGGNTAHGFQNLAPPMGQPLDPQGGTSISPAPPQGFTWYAIDGAVCRDGSPTGIYVRFTASDKLVIYLEGGGACSSPGFCAYNPANVGQSLSGGGESVLGSALGVAAVRQQPGVYTNGVLQGIFDATNAHNPFKDWNQIYVPYCTGDVHFGTRKDATVTGVAAKQQFVGYFNMEKFVGRIVPTFKDKVTRVILTGGSAGSFGAALNFSMVQDAFGSVPVDAIGDSGPPFADQFMPVCMQKRWRELWGLNAALPPDCTECFQADGGGLIGMADFLMKKHPNAKVALISSMQDEVIRLFFSAGLRNCAGFETADPVAITMGQIFPDTYYAADQYTAGLVDLRTRFSATGRLATYYMGGLNITLHQHTFRPRFFEPAAGTETIAKFVADFVAGNVKTVGP